MLLLKVGTTKSAYCRKEITAFAQKQKSHHVGSTFIFVVNQPDKNGSQDNSPDTGRTPEQRYLHPFLRLIGYSSLLTLLTTVQLGGYREVKPVPGAHAPTATESSPAPRQYEDGPSSRQELTATQGNAPQTPHSVLHWPQSKKCSAYHLLLRSDPLKLKELPTVNITIEVGACLELYTDENNNIYAFRAFFETPSKQEFETYQ